MKVDAYHSSVLVEKIMMETKLMASMMFYRNVVHGSLAIEFFVDVVAATVDTVVETVLYLNAW